MSKYTTTIEEIIKPVTCNYKSWNEKIIHGSNYLFKDLLQIDCKSEFFKVIQNLFTRQFILHEINEETITLWCIKTSAFFNTHLKLFSEKYDLISKSYDIEMEFLRDEKNSVSETRNTETETTSKTDELSLTKTSDTPQGTLTGITSNKYLTDVSDTQGKTTNVSNDNLSENRNFNEIKTISGHNKSITDLIRERILLLNNVIEDFLTLCEENLFLKVW